MKIWTSGTCIAAGGVEEWERNHIAQWDGTAKTKIVIKNFKWDKYYTEGEVPTL